MNVEYLREFAYLAETLSFGITAQHFYLSPSVLSKHISAIEDELSVRLLNRDRHHVSLTKEGSTFYHDIAIMLEQYDRALANVSPKHRDYRLYLRIGYLRGAARPFLPRLLHHLETAYPDVKAELTCMEYGDLIRAHRSLQVDVIFNMDFDPEARVACDSQPVYRDNLFVAVNRSHRLAHCVEGIEPDALAGERVILPDRQTYPGYAERCESFVEGICDIDDAPRYRDIDTFYLHVALGECVGFTSGHNRDLFEGHAALIPIFGVESSYTISAQWLKRADEQIGVIARDLADVCAAYMRGWRDGAPRAEI